ncbi:hypothetical protein KIPB_012610, partial [Kipferlia bialata]
VWDVSTWGTRGRESRLDDKAVKAMARMTLQGHRGDVLSLIWTADCRNLFSGARDNTIKIWSMETQECVRTIADHSGDISSMSLLNKETFLLTSSTDGLMRIFKLASLEEVEEEEILPVNPTIMGTAAIIAPKRPMDTVVGQVQLYPTQIHGLALNPRAPYMITSSDYHAVTIWTLRDLVRPAKAMEFVGHNQPVGGVRLTQDEKKVISASSDGSIMMYELHPLRRTVHLPLTTAIYALASHRTENGTLVYSAGTDYAISVHLFLDSAPGVAQPVFRLEGHCGKVEAIVINPTGDLVFSTSHDFSTRAWRIPPIPQQTQQTPIVLQDVAAHELHSDHVTSLALNDSGTLLVTGSADHTVGLWEVRKQGRTLSKKALVDAHSTIVTDVAFGHRETQDCILSTGWDGKVHMWKVVQDKRRTSLKCIHTVTHPSPSHRWTK